MANIYELRADEGLNQPGTNPNVQPLKSILEFLGEIHAGGQLGVISVDWEGCFACVHDSEYVEAFGNLASNDLLNAQYGRIYWRNGEDGQFDGFEEPVNWGYQLFVEMARTKTQWFGGGRTVETLTDRDHYFRPKFPQVFFLDGSRINIDVLSFIKQAEASGELFWGRSDLRIGTKPPNDLQNALSAVLADDALLLQLTNYNLYEDENDQKFRPTEFAAMIELVKNAFEASGRPITDCVVYDRRMDGKALVARTDKTTARNS